MNRNPNGIESLLAGKRAVPPVGLRDDVVETIRQSSKKQMRCDDTRVVVMSLVSLILIALLFGILAFYQHSLIVKAIASTGLIFNLFVN